MAFFWCTSFVLSGFYWRRSDLCLTLTFEKICWFQNEILQAFLSLPPLNFPGVFLWNQFSMNLTQVPLQLCSDVVLTYVVTPTDRAVIKVRFGPLLFLVPIWTVGTTR